MPLNYTCEKVYSGQFCCVYFTTIKKKFNLKKHKKKRTGPLSSPAKVCDPRSLALLAT